MEKTRYPGIVRYTCRDGTITYYVRITVKGKRTWRKGGRTLAEALRYQKRYHENRLLDRLDTDMDRRPAAHLTFGQLVQKYLKDYAARKPDTYKRNLPRIRSVIKRLNSYYSEKYIDAIKARDIAQAYLPRNELIFLRAILSLAVKWEYLKKLPIIDVPKSGDDIGRRLSPDEIRAALDQASPDYHDAILLCLYLGGCRLGELTKINIDNTDFERGTITLRAADRKAGVPKVFIMVDSAAQIIRRRFLANGGRAFTQSPGRLSSIFWHERLKMTGIKPWRFQDLRHTAPSWLEDRGVSGDTLSALLGHRSERMRKRYVHSTLTREREALTVLEGIVGDVIGN